MLCLGDESWKTLNKFVARWDVEAKRPRTPSARPRVRPAAPAPGRASTDGAYTDDYRVRAAARTAPLWGMLDRLAKPDPDLDPDAREALRRLRRGR